MIRPALFLAPAFAPAALAAQTAPNDPNSPPENFTETALPPTTVASDPLPSLPVRVDIGRVVAGEWARYDADGAPGLSQAEFATWMAQLHANARLSPPSVQWNADAFAQTDVDGNGVVDQPELVAFLEGR